MLSFVLVLFVASTAFAAPSVNIRQSSINDIAPPVDNGRSVSRYLIDGPFELIDEADTNIHMLTFRQVLSDMADQPDALSQSMAVSQAIATLGELASGSPGDACEAAAFVDAYANAARTGNYGSVRPALNNFVNRMSKNIDLISQLSSNPDSLRYSAGPRANCAGAGRSYQFDAAWDSVLASASPNAVGLVNEQYCTAKRLYSAHNSRTNNVGAAVTAASLAPFNQVAQQALPALSGFLRAVARGGNASAYAGAAKQALARAVANVHL